uniref:Uncharacterized protein n=1 Tax=Parascaris univalens TaxID=6257 RepID=A0A915B038_PARUN
MPVEPNQYRLCRIDMIGCRIVTTSKFIHPSLK